MARVRARGRRGERRSAWALCGWAAIAVAGTAWGLLGGSARAQPEAEQLRGAELYAANCAACHGPRGEGGPGERGLTAGPPLARIELAYVDQQVRTGRMPLVDRTAGVLREPFGDDEREALLAWMTDALDLEGEIPQVGEGDASRGRELYAVHCAACHGSIGNGGIVGAGVIALGLRGVDPVAMVEAARVGPYQMPAFSEDIISEQDADDIAAFTSLAIERPERSVLGLTEQNRVGLAGVAVLLLAVVVAVAMLIARPLRVPTTGEESEV